MEWVEVRGDTLDAAKEEALDQLGVAREDAEFEVVQEAESRWMGLKKTEARVRARVRPTAPPPKKEGGRNNRRGRRRSGDGGGERKSGSSKKKDTNQKSGAAQSKQRNGGKKAAAGQGGKKAAGGNRDGSERAAHDRAKQRRSSQDDNRSEKQKEPAVNDAAPKEAVPLDEQQAIATTFLEGLVAGFGTQAEVTTAMEDDVIIASLSGSDDLGLLIGPRGGTLRAIQELSRSAVQRQTDGRETNRLMVDVAGYRERRRAALAEFAQRQAEQVKAEGIELSLEPMGSADRKAIHDAVMEIDGVKSTSEGDDPHRRVVLLPDD